MESDRIFEESLEDERSELLYMMNAQKKLFQRVKKQKPPLSIANFVKSPITFAYYTAAIIAALPFNLNFVFLKKVPSLTGSCKLF